MATLIHNVTELQNMQNNLAGAYELANDIDASATSTWNSLNDRGTWTAYTYYALNDLVTQAGIKYYCIIGHISGASFNYNLNWSYCPEHNAGDYLGFSPIGLSWSLPFIGTFNGKDYSISNLYINRGHHEDGALFDYTDNAVFSNIILSDVDISAREEVAGLVCDAEDTDISNCSVSGSVVSPGANYQYAGMICAEYWGHNRTPTMSQCTVSGSVIGGEVGGLIGWVGGNSDSSNRPIITECSSSASVSGYEWAGGLIGQTHSAIINKCFVTGDVSSDDLAGGFICMSCWGGGTKVTTITDCYARGDVHAINDAAGFVIAYTTTALTNCYSTGLVDSDEGVDYEYGLVEGTATVTHCFWDIQTSGTSMSDGGTGKTTAQMKVKFTFSGWNIIESGTDSNSGYPYLSGTIPIWKIYASYATSPRETKPIEDKVTLELIRNVEMSAMGRAYVDKEGNFHYDSRFGRIPL